MRHLIGALCLAALGVIASLGAAPDGDTTPPPPAPDAPLRLAVIGLVHGHVEGVLWQARQRDDLEIVGVWEPDRALFEEMAQRHALDESLYFDDLDAMLRQTTPEAVSVMTSTADHLMAVRACAPRGVHVMVEKPLAVSNEHAREMAALAREHGVHLLTNYETSWYASVREAHRLTRAGAWATPIRRAVFRHGHPGPVEIGCSPAFLDWLTDPEANGAGALFDFGCYGANLMTWLQEGRRPLSVLATTRQLKPGTYPNVDDDATIVLTYERAVGVVQASWAWTHDNKEMDLFTDRASIHCAKWDALTIRRPDAEPETIRLDPLPSPTDNEWSMLREVVRGRAAPDGLMSLENNLIVVEILEAARISAAQGRAVRLGGN
jgi:predicted dehydrogenase